MKQEKPKRKMIQNLICSLTIALFIIAAFCADSSYLVTASSDATARLWNLRTGDVVRKYDGHQGAVTCVALNDSSV